MGITLQIAELEWANYAATARVAQATPGLEVILRPDVILTSSAAFPTPDANHACLLRATAQAVEPLLDEVTAYFQAREVPTTVFLSPACTPSDLPDRLRKRGLVAQEEREAWMAVENLSRLDLPPLSPKVAVRHIGPDEADTAAGIFMVAFEMPSEFASSMAELMKPSIGLPGVYHYLALIEDEPVGTCTLLCYEAYGILGSAGVLPSRRGRHAASNLAVQAALDARAAGVETLMLQTRADTMLERFLRIHGFKRLFTRTGYTL